jgi:hypothetical protein
VEARVYQLTETCRDVAVSIVESISKNRGQRLRGGVDDARAALKLVAKPVILIGKQSPGLPSTPVP